MTNQETPAEPEAPALCSQGMESIRSAMAFSRLSRTELYAMMGDGRLPFVKHGRRRLIPRAALIRALEAGLVKFDEA